jgi:hypothetical protein
MSYAAVWAPHLHFSLLCMAGQFACCIRSSLQPGLLVTGCALKHSGRQEPMQRLGRCSSVHEIRGRSSLLCSNRAHQQGCHTFACQAATHSCAGFDLASSKKNGINFVKLLRVAHVARVTTLDDSQRARGPMVGYLGDPKDLSVPFLVPVYRISVIDAISSRLPCILALKSP